MLSARPTDPMSCVTSSSPDKSPAWCTKPSSPSVLHKLSASGPRLRSGTFRFGCRQRKNGCQQRIRSHYNRDIGNVRGGRRTVPQAIETPGSDQRAAETVAMTRAVLTSNGRYAALVMWCICRQPSHLTAASFDHAPAPLVLLPPQGGGGCCVVSSRTAR
jgi:hypothetical protein